MRMSPLPNFTRFAPTLRRLVGDIKRWMPPMTLNGHAVTLELLVYGHNQPHFTYGAHFHPVYEAHLCLDGRAQYLLANTTFDIEPGMVLLHGPQVPHNWWTGDTPWTILVLWLHIAPTPAVPVPLQWPVLPDVLQELALLLADYQEAPSGWQDRCIARLTAIVSRILCLADMAPITSRLLTPDDLRLERIRTYLRHHLAQPLQVADVAQAVGMSVRSLHRWFSHYTGQSLMCYLFDLRMQQAAELLMRTSEPPARIADAVVIPEVSYFGRRFRAYFDTTPQQYRKLHKPRFLDEHALS